MTIADTLFLKIAQVRTGLPYWVNHIVIALAIGWAFGNLWVGASFYAGREIRDWEKLEPRHFDQKGFWAPVLACAAIELFGP